MNVNNVAPAVTALSGPPEIVRGGTAAFTGEFGDPGDDMWRAEAEIERTGDDPVVVPVTLQADKTFNSQYEFLAAGQHNVTVTVFDDAAGSPVSKSVMIDIFLPGDYDRNGTVEQEDHGFWTQHFGESAGLGLQADGNQDGVVDAADYTVWRDNLGQSVIPLAAANGNAGSTADGANIADALAEPMTPAVPPGESSPTVQQKLTPRVPGEERDGTELPIPDFGLQIGQSLESTVSQRGPENREVAAWQSSWQKDGLLMWLASRSTGVRRAEATENLEEVLVETERQETPEPFGDAFEAAFASFVD